MYPPNKVQPGQQITAKQYNELLAYAKSRGIAGSMDHFINSTPEGFTIKNKPVNGGTQADALNYSFKTEYFTTYLSIQTGYINYIFNSSFNVNGYYQQAGDGFFPVDTDIQEEIAGAIVADDTLTYVLFFRGEYNGGVHLADGQTYRYVLKNEDEMNDEIDTSHEETYLVYPIANLLVADKKVKIVQRKIGDFEMQLYAVNSVAGGFYWQTYNELFNI